MDALTAAHADGIDEVQAALEMPTDADACTDLPDDVECAIASFPYQYDAMPWHGLFGGLCIMRSTSPRAGCSST